MTENAGMPSTPKKKSPPAILLDGFTWGLWKIIELPFLLLWLVLRGLGEMFKGIWKAIGELDGAAWFWKPSNSFFIFLGRPPPRQRQSAGQKRRTAAAVPDPVAGGGRHMGLPMGAPAHLGQMESLP